jgi:uncharacterized protein (DUF2384 family)
MAKNQKIEILNKISKLMSSYAATQWLKKPLTELDDRTPAEILEKGSKSDYNKLLKVISKIKKQ